jgi:hypothetical protein
MAIIPTIITSLTVTTVTTRTTTATTIRVIITVITIRITDRATTGITDTGITDQKPQPLRRRFRVDDMPAADGLGGRAEPWIMSAKAAMVTGTRLLCPP